jgi:Right handed beta helix region
MRSNSSSRPWHAVVALRIRPPLPVLSLATSLSFLFAMPGNAARYYVSNSGKADNSGTSPKFPWPISKVNEVTFLPGDRISLHKGEVFLSTFTPLGSGTSAAPITVNSYGTGAMPIIQASSTNEAAVQLTDQEYWEIGGLEVTGSNRFGIYFAAASSDEVLHHLHVSNCVVHDVMTTGTPRYDSGLIVVAPTGQRATFSDVLVDRVTAYNTNQWWGIHVGYNLNYGFISGDPRSSNITVKNSTVHDVGGDLIVVASSQTVLLSNNVAYNGGLAPAGTVTYQYTPNAIWSWASDNVTVQNNEVYQMHSYGYDGGAFDADWNSSNVTIQYNYAHDNDGYCAVIFGLQGFTTTNVTIRYNICTNNDLKSGYSPGEIYVLSDSASPINGFQIYNNTIYSISADNNGAINAATYYLTGSLPILIKNNVVYSTKTKMVNVKNGIDMGHNIYWFLGSGSPTWVYGGTSYTTPQETQSQVNDPILNDPVYHAVGRPTTSFTAPENSPAIDAGELLSNMGSRDFFGNRLPKSGNPNSGAYQ